MTIRQICPLKKWLNPSGKEYDEDISLPLRLITIAEADRQLKSLLAGEGSAQPDRLNILGDQTFHIKEYLPIMNPQKISAGFKPL